MKRSTKQPVLAEVAEHAPARRAVAAPRRLDGMDGAQERLAVLRLDPVLDLDQHRPVVGPRLDRDREFRQLRARRDVGLVAHAAPARAGRQRAAPASCAAEAASATCVPVAVATPPHTTLPSARLACIADQVHRHRARAHPRGRAALRAGRQARQHAHPGHAGAERAATTASAGRRSRRSAAIAAIHSTVADSHHGVERAALQLPRDRQRADDRADAEARREQAEAAGAEAAAGRARSPAAAPRARSRRG